VGFTHLLEDRRLAQGSAPPPRVRVPFDTVVLAAAEYQPDLPGYAVIRVPLEDRFPPNPPPDLFTRHAIREAARTIAREVRHGRRVLVTCWAGRNRSGVLAGLALCELGVPGMRAASLIRLLRAGALSNPYFLRMVVRSSAHG
jgi:protein-tyrosine phosphatase